MEKFKVAKEEVNIRLDIFCFEKMLSFVPTLTRSQIKNAIDKELIKVNSKKANLLRRQIKKENVFSFYYLNKFIPARNCWIVFIVPFSFYNYLF